MLVIGVTGNFGTGKTTVCRILAELGAVVINADELGHRLLEGDKQVRDKLVAMFGTGILNPDKMIDHKKLAEAVFGSSDNQAKLNDIMHPGIYKMVQQEIEKCRQSGCSVVVLEAALLIEAGWEKLVDRIWVTVASPSTIIERLKSQRGFTEEEIVGRLSAQMSPDEKVKHADVVINTDRSRKELNRKIVELWRRLDTRDNSGFTEKE